MGIEILVNHAAANGGEMWASNGSSEVYYAAGGPRWQYVTVGTSFSLEYRNVYNQMTADRCVITRADRVAGESVAVYYKYNHTESATNLRSGTLTPNAGELTQDYVLEFVEKENCDVFGVAFSGIFNLGKVYFSSALSFASIIPVVKRETMHQTILLNKTPYAVDESIAITFDDVRKSEVAALKALPNLTTQPCFLYESTGTTIREKLMHVIIPTYNIRQLADDTYTVSIVAYKLQADVYP